MSELFVLNWASGFLFYQPVSHISKINAKAPRMTKNQPDLFSEAAIHSEHLYPFLQLWRTVPKEGLASKFCNSELVNTEPPQERQPAI